MSWSIKVAKVAGIEVRIHLTFLLLLAWIGFAYYQEGGVPAAAQGILFILALFLCVLLHEFGHALAARRFGIQTPDITLLPIGGVARLQRMPDQPWQELVVALAGPAVNVGIALVLLMILGQGVDFSSLEELQTPRVAILAKLASINVMLVLFNLIPAFPMDGGRVLRALLAMRMNYARATHIAARVGQTLAFAFGFLGLLMGHPILLFIALFVYLGASQEAAMAHMKDIATGVMVSEAMVTHLVTLPPDATLDQAIDALLSTSQHEFPVVDSEGAVLGVLLREDMLAALKRGEATSSVSQVMRRNLPVIRLHDPFDGAFRLMQECGCPALPVVDRANRFVGLITTENVGEMMLVRSILPQGHLPSWRAKRTQA